VLVFNPFEVLRSRAAVKRQRIRVNEGVTQLKIAESGRRDGMPFVTLRDGLTFYGGDAPKFTGTWYARLPAAVRRTLAPEAAHVAFDIVIRYEEGGLKLGGPKKESRYVPQPGDIVAEMGAYQGFFSLKLAEQVGPTGRVIAIEPMPDNTDLLRANATVNSLDQITVVQSGVWWEKDTMTFSRRKQDGQSASIGLAYNAPDQFEVPVNTLDTIFAQADVPRVDFMVVQLNGAEAKAFAGLTTLQPRNLAIAARYDDEDGPVAPRLRKTLTDRGYKVDEEPGGFLFASC